MKLLTAILLSQIWSLTPEPLPVLDWSLDSESVREEVIQSKPVSVDAPAPEKTEKPLLQIWTQSTGCAPCSRLKSDIQAGRFFGFSLQYMSGNPPERRGFPTILSAGQYTTGWPVSDTERLARIRQLKESAGIQAEPVRAVAAVKPYQPVRMQWNIEGDWSPSESQTRAHLESDHGISTAGMSHQQMLQAHDAAHNGRQYAIRSRPVQLQSCPGGVCPQQRFRFGGIFRR